MGIFVPNDDEDEDRGTTRIGVNTDLKVQVPTKVGEGVHIADKLEPPSSNETQDLDEGATINDFQKIIKDIISSPYFMESIVGSSYTTVIEYESAGDVDDFYDNVSDASIAM